MEKKLIIFDMDGTLYLGEQLFDGVKEVFNYLNEKGIHYVFFTNNSSHDLEFYVNKMNNFGIKCTLEDNFYSSTEVTINYLLKKNAKRVFVVGNKCLKDKLSKHFEIVSNFSPKEKIDAVIAGFFTELVYEDLKNACLYLETSDVEFIATNGDYRCPIEDGLYIPDCGGMIEWMRLCTGKTARVLGKPDPQCVEDLREKYHVRKEETLLVGDRLYTDILCGVNDNVDTLAVLTGETNMDEINASSYKPTYIRSSIKDLIDLLNE